MTLTQQELYKKLSAKLHNVVPDVELHIKSELAYEILRLKEEKNAIILGHNYRKSVV